MPEMKTLNGYEVVDAKARADIEALKGKEVDLSNYATKAELPTKVSQLQNDSSFITREEVPEVNLSEYAKKSEIPNVSDFITSIPDEYITEKELSARSFATVSYVDEAVLSIESGNIALRRIQELEAEVARLASIVDGH